MTPLDWAAIIGAAAWLPQIGSWISRLLARPKIRLIPSPVPEVGFNVKGPILNISGALSASVKDAVIERMTAAVRHESGQEVLLTWAFVSETFSQVRSGTGETAEYHRSQPAVALKVGTQVLVEKLLGFQDLTFQADRTGLTNALIDQLIHLQRTEQDSGEKALKLKELADYVDFYNRQFPWKAGSYTVRVAIYLLDDTAPTVQEFSFSLTKLDEQRLRQNLDEVRRIIVEQCANVPVADRKPDYWLWANPTLETRALPKGRDS